MLSTDDHSRDSAGAICISRCFAACGGVSVGINLNPNNACNWACLYCQVENLSRGGPPPIDLLRLENELNAFLDDVLNGEFLRHHVPAEARRLVDVAFSGNGEPTSAAEFEAAVVAVARILGLFGLKAGCLFG
jgi:wyosine [tRNA(Phe)-imidazoG37] synthetase (radical SAM superfamily)